MVRPCSWGVADPAVALTGDLLEPSPIRNDDTPALLRDQALHLEGAQHRADRGALYTQQLGQVRMGQGQEIFVDPIPRAQDPVAATRLYRMNCVARDTLERLDQQGLAVSADQLSQLGTGGHGLQQSAYINT